MTHPFVGLKQVRIKDSEDLRSHGIPKGSVLSVVALDGEYVRVDVPGYGVQKYYNTRFEPVTASVAGRKDDTGKLDMNLLDDMPRALKAVVQVMQWAIVDKKPVPYERGSWLGVHADRYRAAVKRHDRDACEQATPEVPARFQLDKETNLMHLAHIATSALMALENALREKDAA